MSIGSNGSFTLPSLRNLDKATNQLSKSFEKLSSGKRINRASDDAAGLAIADNLKSAVSNLGQATRNISDAVSVIEVTDGALQQVGDISARLSEISTQAANGTLSDEQRGALQAEYSQLTQEIQRIGETTTFNGRQLFDGSDLKTQVGTDASVDSQITVKGVSIAQAVGGVAGQNIGTVEGARAALDQVSSFTQSIASARGELGASSARLSSAQAKNEVARENSAAAESRIRDLDIADEVARNTALKIQQRGASAVLAQGNLVPSRVLDLLR